MIIPKKVRESQLKVALKKERMQNLTGTKSFEKCLDLLLNVMSEVPEAQKFILERKTMVHLLRIKKALDITNK